MIKTAIVTGATGEIGRAITDALIQNDFAVCAVYNTGNQKAEEMTEKYKDKPFYTSGRYFRFRQHRKVI